MSASVVPAISPENAPNLQALPPKRLRPGWPYVVSACLLLVVAAAIWRYRSVRQPNHPAAPLVRTVRVVQGVIESTRRVSGSIAARRFATVTAPILQAPETGRGLVLTYLADSGTRINEGDVVAKLDSQAIVDHLDDVQDMVSQAAIELRRRKALHAEEMELLLQNVRAAKADLQKAELDARTVEVKPKITAELLKLAVLQTRAFYQGMAEQVGMTRERQRAEMRILELAYERQLRHLKRHQTDLHRCDIKAPMNGLVVLQTIRRHGEMNQIKLGDQLAPGQPFLKVVDTSNILLQASYNQSESEYFHIGQPATIRFDAFPGMVFNGRVESVGAIAVSSGRSNYYIHNLPLRLAIEGSDPRVIPDLTASADVAVGDPENGVIVPLEAIVEREGKEFVYVKGTEAFAAREIEVAGQNSTHAAIAYGLAGGEEIALDPRGM